MRLQRIIPIIRRLWSPAAVLAGQGIQSVANFLVGVLLARFASVDALGDYGLGATILFFVGSLAETLVATPFTYLVLRSQSTRGQNIVFGDHLAYRYEVVDVLGKGSFGQVVRCVDHRDGGIVAVKIIRNKKRFHQQALVEVGILGRLRDWVSYNCTNARR